MPFCAEPIIAATSALFLGPTAVHPIKDTCFKSSIESGPESSKPEVPPAMAALVATLVCYYSSMPDHDAVTHVQDIGWRRYWRGSAWHPKVTEG